MNKVTTPDKLAAEPLLCEAALQEAMAEFAANKNGFFGKSRSLRLSWIAANESFDPKRTKN